MAPKVLKTTSQDSTLIVLFPLERRGDTSSCNASFPGTYGEFPHFLTAFSEQVQ